jgi:hypothetical protein
MSPWKGMNVPLNLFNFSTYPIFIHAFNKKKKEALTIITTTKIHFSIIPKHHFKPQYAKIFKTKHNKSCSYLETTKNQRKLWKKN